MTYLLRTYYILGTILGPGEKAVNKTKECDMAGGGEGWWFRRITREGLVIPSPSGFHSFGSE